MKAIVINGNFRRGWNTDTLVKKVLAGAASAGYLSVRKICCRLSAVLVLLMICQGCATTADHEKLHRTDHTRNIKKGETKMAEFYDFTLTSRTGETVKMESFRGKVVLVVNTATGCGFTPQYAPIEKLYENYHDKGLEILDIPCNQFGGQAPGSDDEIHEFCTVHFNTTFPQMKKADVNGANELPLYTYLKSQKGFQGLDEHKFKALLEEMFAKADPDWDKKPDIKWNFTKFVIDRSGKVVARFEPTADMAKVEAFIVDLLEKK